MEDVHEPVSLERNLKEGRHTANGDQVLTAERRVDKALMKMGYSKQVHAFTEQGVAMLSTVLNSGRAIRVNIEIMRAFVRLRQMLAAHEDLKHK